MFNAILAGFALHTEVIPEQNKFPVATLPYMYVPGLPAWIW